MIVCRFLCGYKFSFFWDKCPGVQLLGSIISTCLVFLSSCQLIFQSGRTILHSYQQHMRDLVSPNTCQHLMVTIVYFSYILTSHSSKITFYSLLSHILMQSKGIT